MCGTLFVKAAGVRQETASRRLRSGAKAATGYVVPASPTAARI
jgi:hypothetical protein